MQGLQVEMTQPVIRSMVVLGYHAIQRQGVGNVYTVGMDEFRSHMSRIHESETALDPSELLTKGPPCDVTSTPVLVTFDDGHISNLEAARVMVGEFGLKGVFFISTNHLRLGAPWMTAADIRELDRIGCAVQSHGHHHRFLNGPDRSNIEMELSESRTILQDLIGKSVDALSFPGGRYSEETVEIAHHAGFRFLFTSRPRPEAVQEGEGWMFHRFLIRGGIREKTLTRILVADEAYATRKERIYFFKCGVQRIVGDGRYQKIWELASRSRIFLRG